MTQGYRSIIRTCEVVREVPCGAHMGFRTTLVSDPASSRTNTFRRPQPIESAVDFFSKKDLGRARRTRTQLGAGMAKTNLRAKAHVLANRVDQIDAYVEELGIETETFVAAIRYVQWFVAAEYRLLASVGIRVDEISFNDMELLLGRERMPVLENVLLSDLLDLNKHNLELVAWSQQQDDAYGCDRFVFIASVLRQIY